MIQKPQELTNKRRVNPNLIPNMPDLIKQRKNIIYEDKAHIYYDETSKEKYTSGTTFIGGFHEKFDAPKIAANLILNNTKYIELYKGYTPVEAILHLTNEWSQSAKIGTFIHSILERHLLGLPVLDNQKTSAYNNRIQTLVNAWDALALQERYAGWEINPEMIVFSDEYKIAGQSDLITINHDKKIFDILDYKTNKKGIERKAFKGKKMYPPIYNLEDCKFNHYALQLSLYAYMLEQELGYKCRNCELIWIDTNDKENIFISTINTPLMEREILEMLKFHKKDLTKK